MPSDPSDVPDASRKVSPRTLTERVSARLSQAGLARDAGARKPDPKRKHLRPTRLKDSASALTEGLEAQRDAQSLRRVYFELKTTYKRYRRRTGKPAVPALRDAVQAFKRGQSLTSLVNVATFLDDRGLLTW